MLETSERTGSHNDLLVGLFGFFTSTGKDTTNCSTENNGNECQHAEGQQYPPEGNATETSLAFLFPRFFAPTLGL